ncbi:MAG TPA: VWA domain-containing protein [Treponemataceae bacterium]|nr:VWA domain-containing protein [Treponemataceae bacterium]
MRSLRCKTVLILLFFTLPVFIFSQQTPSPADRGMAEEEFRLGVQSYYRGSFNEAIIQFEKALSFLPTENLILDWLGKAYYRSGIESAAVQHWTLASQAGYGGLLLQNKIEVVQERRNISLLSQGNPRFSESGTFPGSSGDTLFFSNPVSILPMNDGSAWVIAYGSNELVKVDVNGSIIDRKRGTLTGFDRPMDILLLHNGNLLITEYQGDRLSYLSPDGTYISSFGSKGRGKGELLGPQYAAQDESGNIYVSDFGNARISVFNEEGSFLFDFGSKNNNFSGFSAPSGIQILHNTVYVSDAVRGTIYCFDTSGNFLTKLVPDGTLENPEALKIWKGYLLAADTNTIKAVSPETGAVIIVGNTGNSPSRITCAAGDRNGNILVSDFTANEIAVFSQMNELVGGLFVQIERVIADSFPDVTVELKVENRQRQPVVGLKEVNFFLTEGSRPVSVQKLSGSGDLNTFADITIIIDRSVSMKQYTAEVQSAVREIASSMKGMGTLRIVSAGSVPATEMINSPRAYTQFSESLIKTPYTSSSVLDTALRLCANDLITAEKKRAVIIITDGAVSQNSFQRYGLSEITAYYNNNGIPLCTINVSQNALDAEIQYLSTQTGGSVYYVYRTEGLSSVYTDILSIPRGTYQLTYTSSLPTNFGKDFLKLEAEVYLHNRSGRDETGYFAPLQ